MERKHESDLTAKEKRQLEWEKIKGMGWSKRLEYFWTYYKFVLVILAVLIMLISIVHTMITGWRTDTLLSLGIVDVNYNASEDFEVLRQDLLDVLGTGDKYEAVEMDTGLMSGSEDYTSVMKMSTVVAAGGLDIMICGQTTYDDLEGQDALQDWETFLGEDYARYEPYMTNGVIDLSKSDKWKSNEWTFYTPVYAALMYSSENPDGVRGMLEYFFPEA